MRSCAAASIAKRQTLALHLSASGTLCADGDATRLTQVIGNLLNNAVKYTESQGRIEIHAAQEAEEALISVRDNGIGIEPELLPHVFELFSQAERSLDRAQGAAWESVCRWCEPWSDCTAGR